MAATNRRFYAYIAASISGTLCVEGGMTIGVLRLRSASPNSAQDDTAICYGSKKCACKHIHPPRLRLSKPSPAYIVLPSR